MPELAAAAAFWPADGWWWTRRGLTGLYDWTLTGHQRTRSRVLLLLNPDAPGLFTAVEEQLGLKLVPTKAPVQVLVIDHIERPSEN